MNNFSDVTYCIGSPEGKRLFFRKNAGEQFVYADNDEVFACITEKDKTYFIMSPPPFSDMKVVDFIRYNRCIISRDREKSSHLRLFLWQTGRFILLPGATVRSLSVFAYRAVQCYTMITESTAAVAVNFDGLEYSKENDRQLKRLITALSAKYKLYVSVSDVRFVKRNTTLRRYAPDGTFVEMPLRAQSYRLRRKKEACRYAEKKGVGIKSKDIKKVVVSR